MSFISKNWSVSKMGIRFSLKISNLNDFEDRCKPFKVIFCLY